MYNLDDCPHPEFMLKKQSSQNFGWYDAEKNEGKVTVFTFCCNCGRVLKKRNNR